MEKSQIFVTNCPVEPHAIHIHTALIRPTGMQVDADSLRRKNQDLHQNLQEKTRKQMQTQELYDKLKRRTMLGQVQNAASDAVDHTIQESVNANRFVDRTGDLDQLPPPPPLFAEINTAGLLAGRANMQPQGNGRGNESSWAGLGSQGSSHRKNICAVYDTD
jgi:E3 ubiquitin-protein ligase CCNP1IP1